MTISGNVRLPNGQLPGEVTRAPTSPVILFSKAFPGGTNTTPGSVDAHVVAEGEPSLFPVGTFTTRLQIRCDLAPGDYIVTGRFAGGNLGGVSGNTHVAQPRPPRSGPTSAVPKLPITGRPPGYSGAIPS